MNRIMLWTVVRYLIIGGSSALIEFVIFYFLFTGFEFNIFVANCLGIGSAIVYGFLLQKKWTFRNTDPPGKQIILFSIQVFIAIMLKNILIFIFIKILSWPVAFSKTTEIGLVFFWNYCFCRFVVFPANKPVVA